MEEPNYDLILKAKIDYYGETKAAYEFAANEFAEQKVKYCNIFSVSKRSELLFAFEKYWNENNCDGEKYSDVVGRFLANNCC